MKKRTFTASARGFVLLALLIAVAIVFTETRAAPGPGTSWWTSIYIQNVSLTSTPTSIGSVAMRAYYVNAAGTPQASGTPRIEAYQAFQRTSDPVWGGFTIWLLPTDFTGWRQDHTYGVLPADFEGSFLINATYPVSAVLDLTNRSYGSYGNYGGLAEAQYEPSAMWAVSSTIYFPQVKYDTSTSANHKTTSLVIQNIGPAVTDIQVTFKCPSSYSYTWTDVQPGTMIVVSPGTAGVPGISSFCAAVASSSNGQRLAGVYTEYFSDQAQNEVDGTLLQATFAPSLAYASTTLYAPVFKEQHPLDKTRSRTTGFTIMNVGTSDTNVTATFYCPGQTLSLAPVTVHAGENANFLHPQNLSAPCLGGAKFTSSTSNKLVGIGAESFLNPIPATESTQSATVYTLLPDASGSHTIMFPIYRQASDNRSSGIQVMNVSGSSTHVQAIFTGILGTPGSYTTGLTALGPNEVTGWSIAVLPTSTLPSGAYAVTVTSDTSSQDPQNILGVAVEATYFNNSYCFGQASGTCYDRANYSGYNVP